MAYTTIDNPELYFQTKLYSGNDTDDHAITLDGDENMSPNLVWIKSRALTHNHQIHDTVRGVTKHISSDVANAEATEATGLKSFDSDGFTLGTWDSVNVASNGTYIAWCWKAGGVPSGNNKRRTDDSSSETPLTAVSNTATGTATTYGFSSATDLSNVKQSVNTAGDFSITTYDSGGSTNNQHLCHGLSGKPDFVIWKNYEDDGKSWVVWHSSLEDTNGFLTLDTDAAEVDGTTVIGPNANFTNTSVVLGSNGRTSGSGKFVMYAWKAVDGVSAFGGYTGTGAGNSFTDIEFPGGGFQPRFIMIKRTSSTEHWVIHDVARGVTERIYPDGANTGQNDTGTQLYYPTFTSEGFTYPTTVGDAVWNGDGSTYIYAAFA